MTGEYWIWPGAKTGHGYGNLYLGGGRNRARWGVAHRIAYEAFVGPIPDGHDVHHTCGLRACVNPWHLGTVDHKAHAHQHQPRRSHCCHGHAFTGENTYTDPQGNRYCRTCRREALRRGYWRNPEKARDRKRQERQRQQEVLP